MTSINEEMEIGNGYDRIIVRLDPEKAIKSQSGYIIMYDNKPLEILNLEFEYCPFNKDNVGDILDYKHEDLLVEALYKIRGTVGVKSVNIKYEV